MDKDVTYLSEIISALKHYGGMASLKEINTYIEAHNTLPNIQTNPKWTNNVSAVIQRNCSQTKSYRGGADIFYSVYGLGEGFWGLREMAEKSLDSSGTSPIVERQIKSIEANTQINATEKETIIKARIGQGIFRQQLLDKYHNRCIITGISESNLLIASHIKPWRSANNHERISCENGLLLSPLYDKLFDLGFITFNDAMQIVVSKNLSKENAKLINIDCSRVFIHNPSDELCQNMSYHRRNVFLC